MCYILTYCNIIQQISSVANEDNTFTVTAIIVYFNNI